MLICIPDFLKKINHKIHYEKLKYHNNDFAFQEPRMMECTKNARVILAMIIIITIAIIVVTIGFVGHNSAYAYTDKNGHTNDFNSCPLNPNIPCHTHFGSNVMPTNNNILSYGVH